MIHFLSRQHLIWSKSNSRLYELILEEKAILTYDTYGIVQLLSMYTGNILNSFNLRRYDFTCHIISPLAHFCDVKRMLIDIRTDEIICESDMDTETQSCICLVLQPGIKLGSIMIRLRPTCIEHINAAISSTLICEYAQIWLCQRLDY
jgi:hypothetical protein